VSLAEDVMVRSSESGHGLMLRRRETEADAALIRCSVEIA
jgi:hypothetical protein